MDNNRVCVVTGGSSGIGLAAVEAFLSNGDHVAIVGRNQSSMNEVKKKYGDSVLPVIADVGDPEQVQVAISRIVEQYGKVDVLANNAGTGAIPSITTNTPYLDAVVAWNDEVRIHLTGTFLVSMLVAPHLSRPGGRIINVSSIAAFTGGRRPGSIGYAAAKAGIIGLTYALARELSVDGITVNAIAPGFIEQTGFTGNWPPSITDTIVQSIPVGRAGNARDVASAIAFLSSQAASYITGQVIHVNGGWIFGR